MKITNNTSSLDRIIGNNGGAGLKIGIAVSRFNREITDGLHTGAMRALLDAGVKESDITMIEVPGAFEIPFALSLLAERKTFDALIALGCVIKGETAHFEYVAQSAISGIVTMSEKYGIPISCGVLTTYSEDQAIARSAANDQNKGSEAALVAIEMANLQKNWNK